MIMNCKQIREAIDTASRHNLYSGYVTSHLNDCLDCHRYSDETMSLLGLLGAQSRVETPPDFEFRLRARLLRAQAEAASDPQGFLRKIWPEAFSWGQLVAATAALALIITISTFHINPDNRTPGPSSDITSNRAVVPQLSGTEPAPEIKLPAVEPVGTTPVKFMNRSAKPRPASLQSAVPARSVPPNDIAGIDGSTRLYSPETKRLLKDRSRFYGAETASISRVKPANTALTF
ncbi:MAG: hypothetical protein ACREA2_19730 [Blastocatellia bacterium]